MIANTVMQLIVVCRYILVCSECLHVHFVYVCDMCMGGCI